MLLLIPSLEIHGKFIVCDNIMLEEAIKFCEDFDKRVFNNRKTHPQLNDNSSESSLILYNNYINNDDVNILFDEELDCANRQLAFKLSVSNIPGKRGVRAVFVDYEKNIIGVGTTVVYNVNRAMFNVEDDSIINKIVSFSF